MDREKMTPLSKQEILTKQRKSFGKKYCLHPKASDKICNGNIVKAHTIQKSGCLDLIAKSGKVLTLKYNFGEIKPDVKLVGINSASTFTGFCKYHDNFTFEPIEKHSIEINQKHMFLLGYRGFCHEVFQKRAAHELIPLYKSSDKGKSINQQRFTQEFCKAYEAGSELSLKRIENFKSNFDNSLINNNFSDVCFYAISINITPEVMCCGVIQPQYDFQGNILQDFQSTKVMLDVMAFSIIATGFGGLISFTWIGEINSCKKLIKSLELLQNDQWPDAIIRLTYESLSNIYFSPTWWDSLGEIEKCSLIDRSTSGKTVNPRKANCLIDDGKKYVNWRINSIDTNI